MRILLVHDVLGKQGGAETNLLQVARAFHERGLSVALLHGRETGVGVEEFRAPFDSLFSWDTQPWQAALKQALQWRPDVMYVHKLGHLDLLEALTRGPEPLVRMMHDHDIYCQRSSRYFPWNRKICTKKAGYHCALTCGVLRDREGPLPVKFAWPAKKLREIELSKRFQLNITVADYMSDQLILHGFDPDKITIHPPAPAEPEVEKICYDEKLVIFAGQVIRGKGADRMLEALKRIENEDWQAIVAGNGTHLDYCQKLNQKLGLEDRVKFAGRLDKKDLNDLFLRARVAVVPSLWPEPMPLVAYELMAHAIPIVGFDAGGIPYWLKDGVNGFLAPVHNTEIMAEGILKLLRDPALAERQGRAGQAHVQKNHRFPQYIDRLIELLGSVITRSTAQTVSQPLVRA